jgi:hypothetical protein
VLSFLYDSDMSPRYFNYPKEYFIAQDAFARKMAEVTDLPLSEAYTNYSRFKQLLSRTHPEKAWDYFVRRVSKILDRDLRINYIFDRLHRDPQNGHADSYYGCFRYEYYEEFNNVVIHFKNCEKIGTSPLSSKVLKKRKTEFKAMLTAIKKEFGTSANYRIFSWLNSFEPFRRIFPQEVFVDAPIKDCYNTEAVWGQFVHKDGKIRYELYKKFIDDISTCKDKECLLESFPYKATEVIIPLEKMYKLFGV